MNKIIKYFLLLALLVLVVMQFIRPDLNNEGYQSINAFVEETKPSKAVAQILKDNCYDCHSNHTIYPWYSHIAPVSYWLSDHIKHGKGNLNVSKWSEYSVKRKDHKLEELIEMVEDKIMPLDSYTWLHGDLSSEETKLLIQWAALNRLQYKNEIEGLSK